MAELLDFDSELHIFETIMPKERKTQRHFLYAFCLIVLIELLCGSIESLKTVHFISKPSIVISLIVFLTVKRQSLTASVFKLSLFALLFSLTGDVLLQFVQQSSNYFLGGLVAFLLAHVMYILIFLDKRGPHKPTLLQIIGLTTFTTLMVYILFPHLGELQIAVMAYMFIILLMMVSAIMRKGTVNSESYKLVFIGAMLFLISDSILAINKFAYDIPCASIWIMLTYAFAQYFILKGILEQEKRSKIKN